MVKNAPEIIKQLWEEGFFKTEKTSSEIRFTIHERGYNFKTPTLHSAILRSDFLRQIRSAGRNKFIQSYNFENHHLIVKSDEFEGVELLKERGIHPKIIEASGKLFVDGHYSQGIFEAFKVINIMVKNKSGLKDLDGKDLMAKTFSLPSPKLRWSNLNTLSERNEQEGFMFLFMGAMVGIRNPQAHDLAIQNDKTKTLEYLSFASLLAKRIDEAKTAILPKS